MGSLRLPLGPDAHTTLCVSCRSGVSVSPSPVKVLQSNPTSLQGLILWEFLFLLPDPQVGKPDMGLRTFTPVGWLLWYTCSPVCESPTQQLWDFIVIAPLVPSYCSFSFFFGCEVSFLVSSSVFLLMIVQQLVVIPVLSQEGVSARPSTPPSWTNLHASPSNTGAVGGVSIPAHSMKALVHLCHAKSNLSWSDLFIVSFDGVECSVIHSNYYRSFAKRSPLLFSVSQSGHHLEAW